jgi:RNA polymerase sigma-70 factor (ECF subfamily)
MSDGPGTLQLLARWHSGDETALGELLARELPWLQQQVRRRMGDALRARTDVDDVVQRAMIDVLRHGPRFLVEDREHYRALLLRIVENALRKELRDARRQKRDARREEPLPSGTVLVLDTRVTRPSAAAERSERRAWLQLALELLPPADREILLLRQWEGLSFGAAAERLGIREDAARMRFERALARLARAVERLRSGEVAALLDAR